MAIKTFKGGAHPPERKERTSALPTERLAAKQVVIPLNQHFGAPIQCLVKVGDEVRRGQRIADAEGRMTVPLHASISGKVVKIEPRATSGNVDATCIVIEAAEVAGGDDFMPPLDAFACAKEEALKRVRDAGLVGMGGAGFPTYVKLAPTKPIQAVIANGAECEPYLTIDERTMVERAGDVVEGLAITMRIVGAKSGILGVEENKAEVVPGLEKAIAERGRGLDIKVKLLRTKYPQGGEKMLISALTGREVPSGGLPMDVGCVVQNVGTLVALTEAFREGKPLVERGLTITGGACALPRNLVVPIGSLVSDIAASGAVKIDDEALGRVVFGGPMMGVSVAGYAIPVQKNTSGVLLMSRKEAAYFAEGPCIRCGRCMRACSCRLSPALLNGALKAGALDEAEAIGVLDCVECGTCSFVCPAHIQLVQRFRVGKQLVRAKKQKEAKNAR